MHNLWWLVTLAVLLILGPAIAGNFGPVSWFGVLQQWCCWDYTAQNTRALGCTSEWESSSPKSCNPLLCDPTNKVSGKHSLRPLKIFTWTHLIVNSTCATHAHHLQLQRRVLINPVNIIETAPTPRSANSQFVVSPV